MSVFVSACGGMLQHPLRQRAPQLRALDLFCGAGGATKGLQRAGFHVTGIDNRPQPRYCGDAFIQGDALNPPVDLRAFDFIWASPPCQAYTIAGRNQRRDGTVYADLVDDTRRLLSASGVQWVMENVPGSPLRADLILCGSQFGLPIIRHRLFEFSHPQFELMAPCSHAKDALTICGHGTPSWMRRKRISMGLHPNASVNMKRAAMELPHMNRGELSQAIPPAYAEFIGRQAIASIRPRSLGQGAGLRAAAGRQESEWALQAEKKVSER